jgi:aspartate aminotransferase, mitochondrial
MYSNPPLHGARIVATVFSDAELSALWRTEVKAMADRIASMRKALVDNLKDLKNSRSWKHITDQIGMFAYSGLSRDEVSRLRAFHVCIKSQSSFRALSLSSFCLIVNFL